MSRKQPKQYPRDSCYFCGENGVLESHHVVPKRHDGTDKEKNLVDLCPTCHKKLEALYDERFYKMIKKDEVKEIGDTWGDKSSKEQQTTIDEIKGTITMVAKNHTNSGAPPTPLNKRFKTHEYFSHQQAWSVLENLIDRGEVVELGNGNYKVVHNE